MCIYIYILEPSRALRARLGSSRGHVQFASISVGMRPSFRSLLVLFFPVLFLICLCPFFFLLLRPPPSPFSPSSCFFPCLPLPCYLRSASHRSRCPEFPRTWAQRAPGERFRSTLDEWSWAGRSTTDVGIGALGERFRPRCEVNKFAKGRAVVCLGSLVCVMGSRGWPLGGLLEAVLKLFGGRFGASWGLGKPLGSDLGASWGLLGPSQGLWGASWGPLGSLLGPPGVSWGGDLDFSVCIPSLGPLFGPSWSHFELSWAALRPS